AQAGSESRFGSIGREFEDAAVEFRHKQIPRRREDASGKNGRYRVDGYKQMTQSCCCFHMSNVSKLLLSCNFWPSTEVLGRIWRFVTRKVWDLSTATECCLSASFGCSR